MKNVTVNIQIQFDVFTDDEDAIKEEVENTLDEMNKVLAQRFNDRSPLIFTNSIDHSDIDVHEDE